MLQWFTLRLGVSCRDDQSLDQEMCHTICEERADAADVVEEKSAGSSYSSDVGGTGQSVSKDYALL